MTTFRKLLTLASVVSRCWPYWVFAPTPKFRRTRWSAWAPPRATAARPSA
jgi:hypothetical protein